MPISVWPPTGSSAAASVVAFTKGQISAASPKQLTTPDITGANINSYVMVDTMFLAAHGGAIFSAVVISNGDRYRFEAQLAGGGQWRPCAAMDLLSGYWDSVHRTYDAGGNYAWAVPALGAGNVRMVRESGSSGANTCVASALASHNAFPMPPKYVGKREVTLMVRNFGLTTTLAPLQFDVMQENDDRTRTWSQGLLTRAVRTNRRFYVQGWDAAYRPNGATDWAKVVFVSRPNGAISIASDPKFETAILNAPGRSVSLTEPFEFQNSLGVGQMNVGILGQAGVGLGSLTISIFGFETL